MLPLFQQICEEQDKLLKFGGVYGYRPAVRSCLTRAVRKSDFHAFELPAIGRKKEEPMRYCIS